MATIVDCHVCKLRFNFGIIRFSSYLVNNTRWYVPCKSRMFPSQLQLIPRGLETEALPKEWLCLDYYIVD